MPAVRSEVRLEPASLEDAYSDYSVAAKGASADAPKATTSSARASAFGGNFDCASGSGIGPTIEVNVDISKLHWIVELQTLSP